MDVYLNVESTTHYIPHPRKSSAARYAGDLRESVVLGCAFVVTIAVHAPGKLLNLRSLKLVRGIYNAGCRGFEPHKIADLLTQTTTSMRFPIATISPAS